MYRLNHDPLLDATIYPTSAEGKVLIETSSSNLQWRKWTSEL